MVVTEAQAIALLVQEKFGFDYARAVMAALAVAQREWQLADTAQHGERVRDIIAEED